MFLTRKVAGRLEAIASGAKVSAAPTAHAVAEGTRIPWHFSLLMDFRIFQPDSGGIRCRTIDCLHSFHLTSSIRLCKALSTISFRPLLPLAVMSRNTLEI